MDLNFSAMFQGLGQGTEALGKAEMSKEEQQARIAAEERRQLANQAFQDNLERWKVGKNAELQNQLEDKRITEQQARDVITDKHWTDQAAHQTTQDANTERHQMEMEKQGRESLAINAESKKSLEADRAAQAEQRKQQAESSKAAMERGDAAAALKFADDALQAPRYNFQKAQSEFDAIAKNHSAGDPEYDHAHQILQTDKAIFNQVSQQVEPTRQKAMDAIGYGKNSKPAAGAAAGSPPAFALPTGEATPAPPAESPAPAAAAPADPSAAPMPTPSAPLPGLGNNAPAAPLSDERTAYAQRLVKDKGISLERAQEIAAKAPDTAVKTLLGGQSGAPAAPPTTQPTSFLQPTGQANAAPPAGTAPAPAQPAQPPAASPPAAAAEPAAAGPQPAQLDAMAAKLNQSEEGKAVMSTLARVNESGSSTVAAKMRRAAEIQLEKIFPGQDVNALIDRIIQQNS